MRRNLIVFDINDTLISKINKNDKEILTSLSAEQLENMVSCNKKFLLKRPYTEILVNYLNEHRLDYIFWSTSMKHNIEKMIPYLEDIGYTFYSGYLSQENCDEGVVTEKIKALKSVKNLEVAARIYKRDSRDCILIDNSYEKHIEGQNFIHVSDINLKEDCEIFRICKLIDEFIKCRNRNCSAKKY